MDPAIKRSVRIANLLIILGMVLVSGVLMAGCSTYSAATDNTLHPERMGPVALTAQQRTTLAYYRELKQAVPDVYVVVVPE